MGQAACRAGKRVKFHTAAALVNQLEAAQKQYRLERMLQALSKIDLLIVDELGYISFSRCGAELLFQVFARAELAYDPFSGSPRARGHRKSYRSPEPCWRRL